MALRVTQGATNRAYLKNLNTSQLNMNRSMEKLQTGRKFSRVSDDVRSATKVIDIRSKLYRNNQVQDNVSMSIDELAVGESVLSEISSICSNVLAEMKRAENDPSRFGAESTFIDEIEQAKQEILRLSNKQYNDKFLLGGLGVETEPFTVDEDGRLMFNGVRLCDVSDINDGNKSYNKCTVCRDTITSFDEKDEVDNVNKGYTYDFVDTEDEKKRLQQIFDSHNGNLLKEKMYELKREGLKDDPTLEIEAVAITKEEFEKANLRDAIENDSNFYSNSLKTEYVQNNYDVLLEKYSSIEYYVPKDEIVNSIAVLSDINGDITDEELKDGYINNNYNKLLDEYSHIGNYYTDEEINVTKREDIIDTIKELYQKDGKFDEESLKTNYIKANYKDLLNQYPEIKDKYDEEEINGLKETEIVNELKAAFEKDNMFDMNALKKDYVDNNYDLLLNQYSDLRNYYSDEEINETQKDYIVDKLKTFCEGSSEFNVGVLRIEYVKENYDKLIEKYADVKNYFFDDALYTEPTKSKIVEKIIPLCDSNGDFEADRSKKIDDAVRVEYEEFIEDRDGYSKYPNIKASENAETFINKKNENLNNLVEGKLKNWNSNPDSDENVELKKRAINQLESDNSYDNSLTGDNKKYWKAEDGYAYYLSTNQYSNEFKFKSDHSEVDHLINTNNQSQEKYYVVNGKPIVLSHDNYIDVGLDMAKNTTAVSKFNVSVDGVKALGYGSTYDFEFDKDVSNNLYDMLTDMQEILKGLKEYADSNKNGDGSAAKPDISEFSSLLKKFQVQSENVISSVAEVGVRSKYLETTLSRLENENSALESTKNYLEATEDATEITLFKGYQNAWNLSLQFGGSIIPKSLMDYIR